MCHSYGFRLHCSRSQVVLPLWVFSGSWFKIVYGLSNLVIQSKFRAPQVRWLPRWSGWRLLHPTIIILWCVFHIWGFILWLSRVFHVSVFEVPFSTFECLKGFWVTFCLMQKTRLTSSLHFLKWFSQVLVKIHGNEFSIFGLLVVIFGCVKLAVIKNMLQKTRLTSSLHFLKWFFWCTAILLLDQNKDLSDVDWIMERGLREG